MVQDIAVELGIVVHAYTPSSLVAYELEMWLIWDTCWIAG